MKKAKLGSLILWVDGRDYELEDAKVAVPIISQFNSPVWLLLKPDQFWRMTYTTKDLTKL